MDRPRGGPDRAFPRVAIDAFVRDHIDTAYHPSCTCKMGSPADPFAVTDSETRVIGVEALRVVDSSIMPSITNGNLNAPTIMLAEKAVERKTGPREHNIFSATISKPA